MALSASVGRMQRFQQQDSEQTLSAGIAEYYAVNPHLVPLRGLSAPAREFFRCHDTAHVVFGCGTSLRHEAVVKLASLFGTTKGLAVLRGYRMHEAIEIYERLPVSAVAVTLLESAVIVPRTVARCLRQRKRWPWDAFEAYLPLPLGEVRAEFGIVVAGAR